jgi:hypothetical protein
MNSNSRDPVRRRPVIFPAILAVLVTALSAHAVSWERTGDSVACQMEGNTLWQFSYATNQGKPFFHPLRVVGSEPLTAFKPADHLWHYGLWFSWKYINGVNYWEEDRTGHAQGATKWDAPDIATHADGSAEIKMTLRYLSSSNSVVMAERREIHLSAPRPDGGITLDWVAHFTAAAEPLLLDRTHMPGEPNGAVNGGYAGFSLRAAQAPAKCDFVTIEGPIEKFETDRARPNTKAAACNVTQNGRTDGVAIFSHVSNTGGDSPWYMINSTGMRWFSPALLAPAPRKVKPHETFTWKFRVMTQAGPWTPEKLRQVSLQYDR